MKCSLLALTFAAAGVLGAGAAKFRRQSVSAQTRQDPDTSCGKGFDNLVKGSQDYYRTAAVELWTHPSHTTDNATFEAEFECWFASMCTSKCGGLPSKADNRKKELTETCQSVQFDWLKVWNMFSEDEVKWFKKMYPSDEVGGESEMASVAAAQPDSDVVSAVHYKQAMETAKEVNKKELLCLTLFTIDDECVKWPYIRLSK